MPESTPPARLYATRPPRATLRVPSLCRFFRKRGRSEIWIRLRKASANLIKHKVSFDEAATVFGDPLGLIVPDPRHSVDEERFVLLGLSEAHHLLAVVFTDYGARKATRRGRRSYEKNIQ